jgi:hypothetical protein
VDRRIGIAFAAFLAVCAAGALAVDVTTGDAWQSIIQSASGTTTVNMAAGTYSVTNTLLVPANTTLVGTNRTAILDGGGTCRVVLATGPKVALQGLTVQNGSSTGGGGGIKGFASTSFVYVANCLIQSNAATYTVANQGPEEVRSGPCSTRATLSATTPKCAADSAWARLPTARSKTLVERLRRPWRRRGVRTWWGGQPNRLHVRIQPRRRSIAGLRSVPRKVVRAKHHRLQ